MSKNTKQADTDKTVDAAETEVAAKPSKPREIARGETHRVMEDDTRRWKEAL